MPSSNSNSASDPTRWSLIDLAQSPDGELRKVAMEHLAAHYLPILRLLLRHQLGVDGPLVDDLIQQFLAEKLLGGSLLAGADRQKGRFRGYLRTALNNFVRDHWRRMAAEKRLPDRAGRLPEPVADDLFDPRATAPDLLDAGHAWQVLLESLSQVHAECVATARQDLWGIFEARVLRPAATDAVPVDLAVLAAQFGYATSAQVSNALVTVQRKLARVVRQLISEHVAPDQVDDELVDLRRALQGSVEWQQALAQLVIDKQATDAGALGWASPACDASRFSELFQNGARDLGRTEADWSAGTLAELLAVSTDRLLGRETVPRGDEPWPTTVGELLLAEHPKLACLNEMKSFCKREARRVDSTIPRDICTALYYACIAAAGARLGRSISALPRSELGEGLDWLLTQPWITPELRRLFQMGRDWVVESR